MTVYAQPGAEGSKVTFKDRYENWIGGEWVAPVKGAYFENITPVTGKAFCEVARGRRRTSNWRWTQHTRLHRPGEDLRHRTRSHPEQDRRPH